jgi:sugar lactone lactonase YvrE
MSVLIDYSSGAFAANKAQGVGTITAGTGTYNLAVASYDSVSFSVGTEESSPRGLFFKPDGTVVYIVGASGDEVNEYSLSSAWDVSTATYVQNLSVSASDANPQDFFFKPDGLKMYIVGSSGDAVYEYDLSTTWDISTASYLQNFSVAAQESVPTGLFFKPDGTKMYVSGFLGQDINEYDLSTAWDVSSASYVQNFSVSSQDTAPESLFFNPDGTKMWVAGNTNDSVYQYDLSTAWDVSSASYSTVSFSVASQETDFRGLSFKSDGSKMYVVGTGNDTIYQYSTGTATSLDISSGTYFNYTPTANTTFTFANAPASGTAAGFALAVTGANGAAVYDIANASRDTNPTVNFSVNAQDATPTEIAFNNDGTKMYMVGLNTDIIYQYSLSTAYNPSTASYNSVSFSVAIQITRPNGIAFNNDGTKMFISGSLDSDTVYQYSLSTAFDLSTASYNSVSFSFAGQDTRPNSIAFNNDGTKLFMAGTVNDSIYQYSLSTAFDVSTISYDSVSFSVAAQDGDPQCIAFNNDGTKLFMLGGSTDSIYQYSLSTAFDISTISYDSVSFSVASRESTPTGLTFKPDGTKMYIVGWQRDTVDQYTTGSTATATFSYPASVEWPSGTAPDGPAIGETDVLVFLTDDGGTSYQGFQAGDAMS